MKKLKFYLGIALLACSLLIPLAGIWIATWKIPLALKGTIIGILTVGGPELLAILAVALLGKEAFELFTHKALSWLSKITPKGSVSKTRYHIGLALFLITFLPTYIQGYAPALLPDSSPARLWVNIAADVTFVCSLFILGGDFWDKLRSLFVYDAKAAFPSDAAKTVETH